MLPALDDLLRESHVVALPLRNRFRGVDYREAFLVEGPEGWTEFSPFLEYEPDEAASWLQATIDFGWHETPAPVRQRIPVNATLPAVPRELVAEILDRYPGCRTVKVKVAEPGQALADDVARVAAARAYVGPSGRVRIDANMNWSVDQTLAALEALAPFDLEYVEQPCRTVNELASVRQRLAESGIRIPVAADESVRKARDPLAVARAGGADLLVVKAQPLGGPGTALRIVREAGLPVVVSSAIDTSVGLSMGAALAAAVPELPYDCGLGTAAMLTADVTRAPLLPHEGTIDVRRIVVDVDLLREHAATADRREWWLDRVRQCHRLLEERDSGTVRGAEA
jgi:O-succinylbenzoate synthase